MSASPRPGSRLPRARLTPLMTSLLLAGCLAAAPASAQPITAATPSAQTQQYRIAPGALGDVLAQFAAQSGLPLAFDPALVAGQQSAGLNGTVTVTQGLQQLLAGTGLMLVGTASGYSLQRQPPASDGVTTLGAVTVQAAPPSATTEGSESYAANTITLFKTPQSLRHTPQPVTVLTRQALDDRALPDLHAVMENIPGVSVDYTDSERVNYYARGHQIDTVQFDGASTVFSGSVTIQPDMAVLDHVEVLRGASGLLRGSGNPSAAVNLVRKRPTRELQASATVGVGSWRRHRLEADISGPLIESGALRGRLVAMAEDKHFFQDIRHENRRVFYGALEADLGPDTVAMVGVQYTDLKASGAWGNIPRNFDGSALDLPRSTYLAAAWNRWDRRNLQVFGEVEHNFGAGWQARLSASHTRLSMPQDGFKQSYFSRPAGSTDPYLMNVSASVYDGAGSRQNTVNVTTSGPITVLGREHELVFGAEATRVENVNSTGQGGLNLITGVDIRDWDHHRLPEPFIITADAADPTYTRQKGVYGTARVSLTDDLTAIAGARLSWWSYASVASPSSDYKVTREVTPYYGLVYDLSETLTTYASYTEIFTPQNAIDVAGNTIAPMRGENYEAGIKGEFYGGRLNTAFSAFRLTHLGRAMDDGSSPFPCVPYYPNGYCKMAGGKTRSEGWEVEVNGELLPGWQVMAGYTQTRTRYLRDNSAANVGQPLRTLDPKHMVRLFTTYRFGGQLRGLTVGGGVQAQSSIYATRSNVTAHQGGYAVYNALLSYDIDRRWRVQLNLNNLFDRSYFKKVDPTGIGNYYGDPRNFMLNRPGFRGGCLVKVKRPRRRFCRVGCSSLPQPRPAGYTRSKNAGVYG